MKQQNGIIKEIYGDMSITHSKMAELVDLGDLLDSSILGNELEWKIVKFLGNSWDLLEPLGIFWNFCGCSRSSPDNSFAAKLRPTRRHRRRRSIRDIGRPRK